MIVTLDATTEDAANVELVISDTSTNYRLMALDIPDPELKSVFASSFDTEGEIPADEHAYQNRTVSVGVEVMDTTHTLMETKIRELTQKLAKFNREPSATTPGPSTVKVAFESGNTYVFDVVSASASGPVIDQKMLVGKTTEMTLTFMCRPFARGPSQAFTAVNETSLPVARLTAASVKGDVPGLGKLTVTDAAAANQAWVDWGLRSRFYSNDTDNALFYEAESRTALGGAAVATVSGASGGGSNNTIQQTVTTSSWQAMMSTQASGGGSHLEHIGSYKVMARVRFSSNIATVSVRLDWAQGDFRTPTQNPEVELSAIHSSGTSFFLVDLGPVYLDKVTQGPQRWEGRIAAKADPAGSTFPLGATFNVDCFWLVPFAEGAGIAKATVSSETPTSFSGRDEFDQSAGNLTGKTAPVGGTWVGAGDANDFVVETSGHTAQRTDISDTSDGRKVTLNLNLTDTVVQVDFKRSTISNDNAVQQGVIARYVDSSNYFLAYVSGIGSVRTLRVITVVAGVGSFQFQQAGLGFNNGLDWTTLRLMVLADGRWEVQAAFTQGGFFTSLANGYNSLLATGGTLATGDPGFSDNENGGFAVTRNYDNFIAFAPTVDAAVYASQSLEVRHDRVIREDSSGTVWVPVSSYDGFYLTVPPAGREARTSELIVKASRYDPAGGPDLSIDDLTIDLDVTPRYVSVPEA